MNNLNSVLIEGNLIRDPETNQGDDGKNYCQFSIAVTRHYNQDKEPINELSFFDILTFDKLAKTCFECLRKDKEVRIVGRLKQALCANEEGELFPRYTL